MQLPRPQEEEEEGMVSKNRSKERSCWCVSMAYPFVVDQLVNEGLERVSDSDFGISQTTKNNKKP